MFGVDKIAHFVSGALIYMLMALLAAELEVHIPEWVIMLVVFLAGVAKEWFDKLIGSDVEVADVLATVSGGLLAWLVMSPF